MDYGLQLYSLRDEVEKDFSGALKKIAEIGYTKVEMDGTHGYTTKQIRAMLDDAGLLVSSVHSGLDELDENFDGMVSYLKDIGCTDYVVPWAFWGKKEFFDINIDRMNKHQPRLAAEGITMHFHNHKDEFDQIEPGRFALKELYERTEVCLQIDTYWAFAAGQDPVAVLNQYKDRIRMIHLKDGNPEGEGCALGAGAAPVKAVHDAAKKLGIYMIVESENQKPDGITEITACFDFLKSIQ